MKVLVTGGAGFIGSHLVERILTGGDEAVVIDNFVTGRRDNLPSHERLELVEGSIVDHRLVLDVFENARPEMVVHAAASYRDPDDWPQDAATNVVGTANVVQAAQSCGIKRLLYLQTALCYGLKPQEQPITLNHPIRPEGSSYAISKTAAEQYIALSDLDFISFRLANAYGPRNFSGPLPTFYQRLSQGKPCFVMNTRRDFIFVDDLVEVLSAALAGRGSRGYYHVSSGGDYSIKELYDQAVSAMELDPAPQAELREPNPDDVFSILLDPSKAERDFNWRVKTRLSDGVARAVAYYRQHEVKNTYTHLKMSQE
jgi:UDP-glucose 4-epimerase